ncbi:GvpL/GvpF family gas vesicle protein [Streptomyces sp. NPDC001530]|uniref:GvpL/GvpF family gas vesicle protein n=1 Tax=Streptomyces sp. NPDC001530 TaxID=3364582 RepID=UPI00368ABF9D
MPLYVYAITGASHPLRLDDLKGVGDPPTDLRAVRGDSVCAVVSETPDELTVNRRDMDAHHEVQARLFEEGTTLPLHFGLLAQDEDSVRAVLAEREREFSERLDELTGRVEFNLKAAWDEEAALREILEQSEEIRNLNEATRRDDASYEDRLALGEMVAQEVLRRQEALAAEIVKELQPLVHAERIAPPSDQYAVNASFLVDREHADEFAEAGRQLAERLGEQAGIRVLGPLPPYSFA